MNYISRRTLLYGLSGFAASTTLASLGISKGETAHPVLRQMTASLSEPLIDSKTLEKPNLTLAYLPVVDCIPIAIAHNTGLFRKYGLNVTLSHENSWSAARNGVIFGRLDAAPVVAGAVINAQLGALGAEYTAPLCAAMTLHRHGSAITFNRKFWDMGLHSLQNYQGDLQKLGRDLHRYFHQLPPQRRAWATTLDSAIHEYFIYYLAAAAGIHPLDEFRTIAVSPTQMMRHLKEGAMQAFIAGEPWNLCATQEVSSIGFTLCRSQEIWQGHPNSLLAVLERFIKQYPKTYRSLVKALIEACQYCSRPENQLEVAAIFDGQRQMTLGSKSRGQSTYPQSDSTLFFNLPTALTQISNNHSTFLWQSQCLWLIAQAVRWGKLTEIPQNVEAIARKVWKTDLYREIATEMDIACPAEDYQCEAAERFIDRSAFDPSNLTTYLKSFEIRAKRPVKVFTT
jgi:nitrate/nitrite transport system substrate-binding protein